MGWAWRNMLGICLAATAALEARAEPMSAGPWAARSVPVVASPSSIGGPAAGCLVGAVALQGDTPGLQVLRPQRNRFWGHPRLVAYLKQLGQEAVERKLAPLLVGDMSQPRGGPMAFGHGSHQNGLDADIWFRLPNHWLSPAEQDDPVAVSMVAGRTIDPRRWSRAQLSLLEMAASSAEVDRIFVNPAIKAAACKAFKAKVAAGQAEWLGKLRPWWGHDEHFHIRLSCTLGDGNCQSQKPPPPGDGCGDELASWLDKSTVLPANGRDQPNPRRPDLPGACTAVLAQPDQREARMR